MSNLKSNAKAKRKRPKLTTKEELILYLDSNPETEFPFVEELWEKCVIGAKEHEAKGRTVKTLVKTDKDGNKVEKEILSGFWSDNPVSHYFQKCTLKQWRLKGEEIANKRQLEEFGKDFEENILPTVSTNEDDSDDGEHGDEVVNWINLFKPNERFFLKQRYVNYYEQYEINDGADKSTLKGILSLEIALHRIDIARAKDLNINVIQEEKLRKSLKEAFESLKWTKKQRNARDDIAQNKFTVWISDASTKEHFEKEKTLYEKDQIDEILDIFIDSSRKMME